MFSIGLIKEETLCSIRQLPIIFAVCEHYADDCLILDSAYSSEVLYYKCLECLADLPLAIVLGLTTVAIWFNIQHDGGHSA